MVGKKSGRTLLREEGLERTDNNMEHTSWPTVTPINQKNYYTDYLKRDDQLLVLRLQNDENRNRMMKAAKDKDRALANGTLQEVDVDMDDDGVPRATEDAPEDFSGSKVVVIHPGSRNLRIGLASDALPKTIPMVIARKCPQSESELDGGEPKPKRTLSDENESDEQEPLFDKDFTHKYNSMCADLKLRMRNNKRRMLPNSKELVVNFNKRTPPEDISEHNDSLRVEWTELPTDATAAPDYFTGAAAVRIPDRSQPRYRLFWPLQHGWYNERDYPTARQLEHDIALILEDAIKNQLGLRSKKEWGQYGCVFIVPDLYERRYVISALELLLREFGFGRVCFIQESLAATFGAGYTSACVVDIGAQKTSICCVDEGMCVENSRLNLKYGGADVVEAFVKMLLMNHFPYSDINLKRRYDFLLAEELTHRFCTMNDADISVQLYDFHLRAPGQDTKKYYFKTYDEVMLAPMGLFEPSVFDMTKKLLGRRKLIDRSYDLYDSAPNDPMSAAQLSVYEDLAPKKDRDADMPLVVTNGDAVNGDRLTPALSRQTSQGGTGRGADINQETSLASSLAGSPAPEAGRDTPQPGVPASNHTADPVDPIAAAEERDRILPVMPLDHAIFTSIAHGAQSDERKMRDFLGGIMVVGGVANLHSLTAFLEERLKELRPGFAKDIMIGGPPRELDPQVVIWKGGSVFAKLHGTNDSWISQLEFDRLGSRVLPYKCIWAW